jgi:hypothetical protein
MSVTTRRLLALPIAAAALLTAPVAANAAMGGANALTTALRPDLRSATVQSTNTTDDTTTVRVCFSKAIASLPQAARFHMGNYANPASAGIVATSATRSTSNCADAVFPNSDATQHTFITVDGSDGTAPDSGGSAVSTNGFGNIQDSTALIGSKTNNGTRGFGAGPDLVGITANNAASTIDFTFDQQIAGLGPAGALAGAFVFHTQNGTAVPSIAGAANRALSSDGLTVRVNFPAGSVTNAVRAHVTEQALAAKAGGYLNGLRQAARPGNAGFTDKPDLVGVTLASDGSSLDFQYDQVLTGIPGGAGAFRVQLSNSQVLTSGGAVSIVGGAGVGNTVRLTCPACNGVEVHELLIGGQSDEGAVTGAGGGSTAGGLPTGGNAGAFATGFTTAPEALSVTFDNATNVASVVFDQRWLVDDRTKFKLIDDQGSQISAAAISVTGSGSPTAGKTTAQITFPAGTLVGARSLLIQFGGVITPVGPTTNVQQAISPTAPAAKTARKFRKAKTITRKQRAAMRRAAKRR